MRYNPALEGLRALAIIFVVCHHVVMATFPGFWIGVDVFFFAADNHALAILNCALIAGPERLPRNSPYPRFNRKNCCRLAARSA
jgi:hypothetical protein